MMRVVVAVAARADKDVGGRSAAGKGAEVFATQHRRQADHAVPMSCSGDFAHDGSFFRGIPGDAVACLVIEGVACACRFAERGDKFFDALVGKLALCLTGSAYAASEFGAVRDDVGRTSRAEHGVGDDHAVVRRDAPRNDALE